MMNFVKRKMSIMGLLMLFILISACRDQVPDTVVEQQAITVAFKMPEPVNSVSASPVPGKKAPALPPEVEKITLVPAPDSVDLSAENAEYTGEGKVDPFIPLIKNEPVRVKEPLRPRTPLEQLDYSQMKLVAIVGRGTEYVAMVEEAGGKGYIVRVGTYIGRNGGVVSEIHKDRVIVQERLKDFKGDMITHTQEIKLNKTEDKEV